MQIRASVVMAARAFALGGAAMAGGCGHASATLMVDVPKILPYQPPDIDDITGIDSEEAEAAGGAAGSASAQSPH